MPQQLLTRAPVSEIGGSRMKIAENGKQSRIYEKALKHSNEVEKCGEICQGRESGKEGQVLDPAEEEALKRFKGVDKLGGSCLEIAESGNEKQVLNSVEEETWLCCKEVPDVGEDSCQKIVESVEVEAVERFKEVANLG